MRRLLPTPAEDVDLRAEYAYPDQPWLRANFVSSVDGAAAHEGRSRGLSNAPDKHVFQLLRFLSDVVIAGAGTARVEGYRKVEPNPAYTQLRADAGQPPVPVLCVVSGRLDLDLSSGLFGGPGPRTILVTNELAPADKLARAREVADVIVAGHAAINLPTAVAALHERGHRRLMCEGGPTLMHHLTRHGLVDELCLTVSPLLTAGGAPRVLDGPLLHTPVPLRLHTLLEEDDVLFTRYLTCDPGSAARAGRG